MTPDEVRMLDNRYALLFIRGERPVMDEKFDILKHPNIALTTDGKGKPYLHGEVTQAVASMILLGFGIVQIGLSLKSHDPSQRANGFLTLAGGVIITFAKEILTLIAG